MKKILILIILSFTILLGCTKSDLGNSHEDLTLNSSSEVSGYYQPCRGRVCHTCNQCRGPHDPACYSRCTCYTTSGQHTTCAICGGCIDARIGYVGNTGCVRCDCNFEPQSRPFSCFAASMSYLGRITELYRMTEEMVITECKAAGLELGDGIRYDQVNLAMKVILDDYFTNWEEGHRNMKSILDNNEVIITNYPVHTPYGPYGHTVVIIGYVGDSYACLDPATGEYIYMSSKELEWKNSEGKDSINKFVVSVPSLRWIN